MARSHPSGDRGHDRYVGGEPVDGVELVDGQPAQLGVLQRLRPAVVEVCPVGAQRAGASDRRHVVGGAWPDSHGNAELLADLAHERLRLGLAGLDFAARQLPAAGQLRRPGPPGGEQRRWIAGDDGGRNDDETGQGSVR